jgi:hypothetical protein
MTSCEKQVLAPESRGNDLACPQATEERRSPLGIIDSSARLINGILIDLIDAVEPDHRAQLHRALEILDRIKTLVRDIKSGVSSSQILSDPAIFRSYDMKNVNFDELIIKPTLIDLAANQIGVVVTAKIDRSIFVHTGNKIKENAAYF